MNHCFSKGFDATTVSDIVARSVSPRNLLPLFAAKLDIGEALRHVMDGLVFVIRRLSRRWSVRHSGDADVQTGSPGAADRSVTIYNLKNKNRGMMSCSIRDFTSRAI